LESAGIKINGVRVIHPRMEEAFISLIHRVQRAGSRE
jgi:hypothetical protein